MTSATSSNDREYLEVRFDVTGLSDSERDGLALEVVVQAENSEHHPDLPVEIDWVGGRYDEPSENELRADDAEQMLSHSCGWGDNDPETDASDALANVIHWCARVGLDPTTLWDKACLAAEGDLEDGPEARFKGSP